MALRVECQFCGHISRVSAARAGHFFDCPECGARLTVPDPSAERIADDEFGFDRQPAADAFLALPSPRFWAWTFRLVAGSAIVALLIALIVVVGRARNVVAPARQAQPAVRAWPPKQAPGNRKGVRPLVAKVLPALSRKSRPAESQGAPRVHVAWKVVPDPSVEAVAMPPEHVVRIPFPEGPNPEVVFPATPSTMVSVGNVGHGREHREIWDFRAKRRIGTTRGLRTYTENLGGYFRPISALSADGRLFVTQGNGPFDLAVWDVVANKQRGILTPEHAPTAGLIFAAFVRSERLLACGFGTPFQIFDVTSASKKQMQQFPRENKFDRCSLALSPGGRFLAVFDKSAHLVRFYETESGVPAGQLGLPAIEPAGPMNCECVAFSPDSSEVAALLSYNNRSYLACWDLRTGRLAQRIDFGGDLRRILGARFAYLHTPLEWFPNGKRWLVHGQGIVSRHPGKLTSALPDEPNRWRYGLRHVVGDDCVLSVAEEKGAFVLASLRPPTEFVDPAQASPGRADGKAKL